MFFQKSVKRRQTFRIAGLFVLFIMTCIVLFRMNTIQAVALEQELRCGIEEHAHTDACYDGDFLVCEKSAHLHDGNCYIVLLNDNDVNGVLTLIDENEENSLEYAITDEESVSQLTLNKNLNTASTLSVGTTQTETVQNGVSLLSVGDDPVTASYNANFYIYLDGKWTCIGTLPFTTSRNGIRYNSTIPTSDVLEHVNGVLGTEYEYNSFDISVASSLN